MTTKTAQYSITPLTPMTTLDALQGLIGSQVQARPMCDPVFSKDLYIGTITQVKLTQKCVTQVYFKTPDLVGGKWLTLDRVMGWAHIETAAAVVDQPAAESAVIETPAAAQPVAAQPAHMTDHGRAVGVLGHVNLKAGYGFIDYMDGDFPDSVRFDTRNVFGGAQAMIDLMGLKKGTQVSFAHGTAKNAVGVVIPGHEKSESHYASYAAIKAGKSKEPLPRARQRLGINERVERKSAADKAALVAALNSPLA